MKLIHSNLVFFNDQSHISVRRLLRRECKGFNDTVLIESPFKETSRDGTHTLRLVRLALTSKTFVIASGKDQMIPAQSNNQLSDTASSCELLLLYPWNSVKLYVFKKTQRKCIKAIFIDKPTRYFELQEIPKMKIHWHLWCCYIIELHKSKKTWPFSDCTNKNTQKNWETQCVEISVLKHKKKVYKRQRWTDKYLYLGLVREVEDQIRPRPVPGLGKPEEIKVWYLKPRYFGCWEQSEHWVQCGESSPEFKCQNDK